MTGLRNRRRPLRTPGRVAAGKRYTDWLASPGWHRRRQRWASEEQRRYGRIVCALCGARWSQSRGDLHHLSYSRMGRERHEDLMAMCRPCHELVHQAIDASRSWQRLISRGRRRQVTLAIIESIRQSRARKNQGTEQE
ncbi:hypothetical protein BKH13_12790 [Actinomyces naeslundii]|uniref:HNH endonuclease n=1 Tax=Actinomyces naeslundii TaxID=1655 RepID=A0ABX3EYC4_ACTNA|nr:hypothetical protein [Actinomyces naeslundii]OLO80669.1 hypothetical protein BKH13_12790 [Actinomyces naeslundii]